MTRRVNSARLSWAAALVAVLTAPSALAAQAEPGRNLRLALQRYQDALAKVRWTANDGAIQGLYEQALTFGLDRDPVLAAEMRDFLAKADAVQRAALAEDLHGLRYSLDPPDSGPDLDWFRALAKKAKAKQSQRFLDLQERLRPRGEPAWLGEGGCTRLGEGLLTELYGRARDGADAWPNYRGLALKEATTLLEAMTGAGCVCGDAVAAERELRRFVKERPDDTNLPRVEARLRSLLEGAARVRYACRSLDSSSDSEPPRLRARGDR